MTELRATDLLADLGASLPKGGLGLYVTDTLDDPYAEQKHLGSGQELISQSRSRAAKVKAKTKVTIVIGNPPYRERAEGPADQDEQGSNKYAKDYRPLDDYRAEGNGRTEYVLKNLYVYFLAICHLESVQRNAGVVCFITPSGFLRGPGFKGMRHLRGDKRCARPAETRSPASAVTTKEDILAWANGAASHAEDTGVRPGRGWAWTGSVGTATANCPVTAI